MNSFIACIFALSAANLVTVYFLNFVTVKIMTLSVIKTKNTFYFAGHLFTCHVENQSSSIMVDWFVDLSHSILFCTSDLKYFFNFGTLTNFLHYI